MCQLTRLMMRPRVADDVAQGSDMLAIETEQSVASLELYIKHSTLMPMLACDTARPGFEPPAS